MVRRRVLNSRKNSANASRDDNKGASSVNERVRKKHRIGAVKIRVVVLPSPLYDRARSGTTAVDSVALANHDYKRIHPRPERR